MKVAIASDYCTPYSTLTVFNVVGNNAKRLTLTFCPHRLKLLVIDTYGSIPYPILLIVRTRQICFNFRVVRIGAVYCFPAIGSGALAETFAHR